MHIVTLLTDFGETDYFVGAMKGALLSVNPEAKIVDITHDVPAHDIEAGAFTLFAACETFPKGTTHVAVVDPGVGSERRAIVVETKDHLFVGPDNGIFGYIYERAGEYRVFHLTNEEFFRRDVSSTFHGRDVFAPVAGALSLGVSPEKLGPRISDEERLERAKPIRLADGSLEAAIIHIDRFGNCITNISRADLQGSLDEENARIAVNGREVKSFRRFFAEGGSGEAGEDACERKTPFAIWGSAGLLEIALNLDSAARSLEARRGQTIRVTRAS